LKILKRDIPKMSLFPASYFGSLPLQQKMTLDKRQDWVGLWESLEGTGPAVFLESAGPAGDASRWLILAGDPEKEFFEKDGKCWARDESGIHPSPADIWPFMDGVGQAGADFLPMPFCLSKAWFGILSYEFGRKINPVHGNKMKPAGKKNAPDFHFFKPRRLMAFDRLSKETFVFGNPISGEGECEKQPSKPFRVGPLRAQSTLGNYESVVRKAQDYISRGDIYQANLAQSFKADWQGNAGSLYRALREMNPGPFMGIYRGPDFTVVSSSPERLAAGQGDWLETRPIAGTRPRGKDSAQDLQLQWELKTSQKEQAEHLMLVDLARNDLGRVARYGTVEVRKYSEIESYARVHHLVSTVQARRLSSAPLSKVLQSLFPGGTITGCPKIRCMEIIDELEAAPRGYYTGSMGYLAPGPCFDFNILIRSFTLWADSSLEFRAGAGIVADSDPGREYMETLYKVEALAQALGTSFFSKT
jgi:anthranilate/para-aminobenzoate synthase component I